ncbi:valine--tRNA ligase [Candidatus Saccharibacteria bacterium]|nr:valine--tRNA ligase [Candidatus Saccharibacteria bacterium]
MKLSKTYEPNQYEEDIYALWEKQGAFAPVHRGSKETFCIVMPPPNANAGLHIGYTLTSALEDITARYHRLKGRAVLLLPGADHAGFETQVVYEKKLAKEGKSRFDFSRDELYTQIWDFVAENKGIFENQIRAMGASCDWDNYTFTLDQKIVDRAYKTFKNMWDEGLIYRGERLVNFCTYHETGFADIEVVHEEVKGHLWEIDYPLTDGSGKITVATTRPETMLGDVAVAVHPKDKRYKEFVGKTVKLPLTDREIPILSDEFVDKDFGTGAVKITPAHDPNDFEVGQRHDLPKISVIGHNGKITNDAPKKYRGLTVEEARKAVVEDLDSGGFLANVKDHVHNVGHCYKCKTVIEPLLKEQWFIDMQPLAKKAIKSLKNNEITFYPESKKDQLVKYLEGLRDWNISRQIAWGIPIPAFVNVNDPEDWIFNTEVTKETIEVEGKTYRRDPDVFDTWFSSSSWPYATLEYPDNKELAEFYPNGLMETGGEILYPWVSRMVMLGLYVTGKVPFKEVYIHGYVMAEDGSKMSKSIGNVVDPMPVIKEFGSDALRMGIISGRSAAVNTGYDSRRVVEARNFCNKLWNIARYIESSGVVLGENPEPKTLADHWILSRLNWASARLGELLESYEFSEAYELVYHLIWDDVADWYIEASKSSSDKAMLGYVLETILKLAHPFAPFLTETIWQTITPEDDSLIITSSWPKTVKIDEEKAEGFQEIKAVVSELRQIKTALLYDKGSLLFTDGKLDADSQDLIKRLAKLEELKSAEGGQGLQLNQAGGKYWLDVDRHTAKKFIDSLKNREVQLSKVIDNLNTRLRNPSYTEKAPEKLVNESRAQLADAKQELGNIIDQIKKYGG